jgi:preprotein translocase subunit SecG
MAVVILIVHLILCVGLIGLVLLQRSEGGALGIGGGGGGGSLMSGRGAADALARLTSIAGGLFLATSIGLTMISGASSNANERSVFDMIPSFSSQAPEPSPFADPALDDATALEPSTELVSASPEDVAQELDASLDPNAPVAPAPDSATARAGPVAGAQPEAAEPAPIRSASVERPAATPASTTRAPPPRQAASPRQGSSQPAAQTPTQTPARTPVSAPAQAEPAPAAAESGDGSPQVDVVRRQRAGPEQ